MCLMWALCSPNCTSMPAVTNTYCALIYSTWTRWATLSPQTRCCVGDKWALDLVCISSDRYSKTCTSTKAPGCLCSAVCLKTGY